MSTATFDKNITLDKAAAERLVEILSMPTPPHPELTEQFWADNERKLNEWLSPSKN